MERICRGVLVGVTAPFFNETSEFVKLWEYNNWGCYRCGPVFQIFPDDIHGIVMFVMYCAFISLVLYGFALIATDKKLEKRS